MANNTVITAESGLGLADEYITRRFDSEQENAVIALQNIVRSAQNALETIKSGNMATTDFVSQYAAKYADALGAMNTYSQALGTVRGIKQHLAE